MYFWKVLTKFKFWKEQDFFYFVQPASEKEKLELHKLKVLCKFMWAWPIK